MKTPIALTISGNNIKIVEHGALSHINQKGVILFISAPELQALNWKVFLDKSPNLVTIKQPKLKIYLNLDFDVTCNKEQCWLYDHLYFTNNLRFRHCDWNCNTTGMLKFLRNENN